MTWTKRDRIEAVFAGQQPDRVPIYELLVNDAVVEHFTGKKLHAEDFDLMCEAVGACCDMTRDIFAPFTPGDRPKPKGGIQHYERWTSWTVEHPFHDRAGAIRFIKDDIDILNAWSPSAREIAEFKARNAGIQRMIGEAVDIFVCPNANVNYCFNEVGMQEFCYLTVDEPELIDAWLLAQQQNDMRRIDAFADPKESPCCLIYADIAQKGGLTYSLRYLQRTLIPHVQEICDLMHGRGMKVIFHSDGDIMTLLPDLVKCGVDGLNPLEIAAGMDIARIKKDFGHQFVICGGMDVSHLMPFGTKDQVVQAAKNLMKMAGSDFGLCLGSTTELGNDIPLENALAMFETVWEHGKYPFKF